LLIDKFIVKCCS